MSNVRMVFGLAFTMAPFVLVAVVALFMEPFFLYFIQEFPNFCVQSCGIGFRFMVYI